MPQAIPFIPMAVSGIAGLIGKKKATANTATTPYAPNPAYTKPLTDFGGSILPQAQQGFQKSMDYYGNVMDNPEQATASDAASIGRQSQQATQRLSRQPGRGGAAGYAASQIPGQAMTAGLERRLSATQGAAANLGQLSGTAGGLGANIFGNLMGNQLGGYQASSNAALGNRGLDLRQTEMDRDYYGKIGGSIFDTLTKKPGVDKGSIFDKIFNRGGGGGGSSGGGWGGNGPGDKN